MKKLTFKQENILDGQSPIWALQGLQATHFSAALNIDPDLSPGLSSTRSMPSGMIQPIGYTKFSSTLINGAPMWIMSAQKGTELVYAYLTTGRLISYTAALGSETNIGTPTSGAGNGMVYYNNYLYLATPTDISRYGPLDGTPAIANTFWSTTLGLTAMVNTTYPSGGGVVYPNHAMHVHTDGALYICDFDSTSSTDTTRGKGIIHKIKTKYGTSGTAHEGAVNDGSAYNVLDLPPGYMPTDIESYGLDLVISAVRTTTATLNRGNAALFFWDTISKSFYRQVDVPYTAVTALLNKNGELYAFAGNFAATAVTLKYLGGYSFETVDLMDGGIPPMAGGVASMGNRILYGTTATWPIRKGVVRSLGYRSAKLPRTAVQIPASMSADGTADAITAIAYVQQASGSTPRMLIGWQSDATYGIDSVNSSSVTARLHTQNFQVGKRFRITKIIVPLGSVVDSSTNIEVLIRFDNTIGSKTLPTINNTNYSGQMTIVYGSPEIDAAVTAAYVGQSSFVVEFYWNASGPVPIMPGIEIEVETYED